MTRPLDALKLPGVLYFASGANRVGEIWGLTLAGLGVGLAAPEVMSARTEGDALDADAFRPGVLEAVALDDDRPVFVDSGAFSEVRFGANGPEVVRPMTDEDWARVFALYQRLAWRSAPGRLSVVAPDRIGDQAVTLERVARYAGELANLDALGARVLFPVQKGGRAMADFFWDACELVGFEMTPAIPMKKDATSLDDLEAFLRAVKPARVHLLGLGPRSRSFGAVLELVARVSPGTAVQCDSVALRSLVGRTNGPGKGPRALTAAADRMAAQWPTLGPTHRKALAVASLASSPEPSPAAAASLEENEPAQHAPERTDHVDQDREPSRGREVRPSRRPMGRGDRRRRLRLRPADSASEGYLGQRARPRGARREDEGRADRAAPMALLSVRDDPASVGCEQTDILKR